MLFPWRVFDSLFKHRSLIRVMVKRDVLGRYRGSFLGLLWSFFNPLLQLFVYTVMFGSFLGQARPQTSGGSNKNYAVFIFSGMIAYLLFADCLNRAPLLILQNTSYVKKVVFPLEILPWVTLGSAVFHFLVSVLVLLAASLVLTEFIPWTIIFFPLPLICLSMFLIGCIWFLASLGVFLRDISNTITVLTSLMLFLSPVFYKIDTITGRKALLFELNPLTFIIQQMRRIFITQELPDFRGLAIYFVGATLFAWLGLLWFQKTRKGFADVL